MLIVAVLYLFLVMPRVFFRPDLTPLRNRLYAHRGVYDNKNGCPENSLPAFKKAIDRGFGIEFDVHLSKDGQAVVFHDFKLDRAAGVTGKIEEYTFDELRKFSLFGTGEKIPSLKEVLDLAGGRVPLLIEIKSEDFNMNVCRETDRLLREYKGVYCIESFNPIALLWFRKHEPGIVRGQLSDHFTSDPLNRKVKRYPVSLALQSLILDFLSRPDFISYNYQYHNTLSRRITRRLFGARSAAWTIKSQKQLENMKPYFDIFIFDSFIPEKITG